MYVYMYTYNVYTYIICIYIYIYICTCASVCCVVGSIIPLSVLFSFQSIWIKLSNQKYANNRNDAPFTPSCIVYVEVVLLLL